MPHARSPRPRSTRHATSPPLLAWRIVAGLLAVAALALTLPRPASSMPPPAPGNKKGLPASVVERLRQDPSLFYPKKGFKPVIARQKAQRAAIKARLVREGMSARLAEQEAASRISTVRFCPVLCGQYADKPSPDWPVADLVDQLFSLDYGATNTLGQPGSMREHYRDMSYGTFDLQGGVFGWFALPQNGLYYYSDDNGLGTDRASGEAGAFIRHTLQAADATVDFRPYDNDGPDNVPDSGDDDGVADLVMFVHPNEGGECGGAELWSHSFHYQGWPEHNGQSFVTNDIGHNGQPIQVDDYVIMPAISCFGGRIEIGVFSHEFGHALGLPDLYDRTAYDPVVGVTSAGMGLYCLMAAGSYGGDYAHPAYPTQMCAWSKEELGFLTPHEIVCDETSALYYQGDAPEAVKLWRGADYSQNEWFLVENRQRKKWDKYLRGTGFLITHADNNVTTQNDESCPNGNPCLAGHYQLMVVEADNQWEMEIAAVQGSGPEFGEPTDFFNAANNDSLTDLTLPSTRDHGGMTTGVRVTGIGPSADKMVATFSVSQTCASTSSLALMGSRITGGCDLDPFLDPGEKVSLDVTIRNLPTAAPATGITGTLVSLSPQVSVVSGTSPFPDLGHGKFGDAIVPFEIQASAAATCSTSATLRLDLAAAGGYSVSHTFTVRLALDNRFVSIPAFSDNVEGTSDNGWKHYAYANSDDWSRNTNANHTLFAVPGHSWFSAAPATGKDVLLEPPAFIPSATSKVRWWHRYDTEDDWDGCVLELSTDGGSTWEDVGHLSSPGYDDTVMVNPQSPISGRWCWNGLSSTYPLFRQDSLSVAPWAGQECILRFRMGTDFSATGTTPTPGWNIDDLEITNAQILRERCEATPLCGGAETTPPSFAGLEAAVNRGAAGCDVVDLKWPAATDASSPLTYLVYASTSTPVPTTTPIASTPLLKYRVTGLTPNQTYYFLVRARDSQGNVDGNSVEKTVTMDCDPPNLVIESVKLTETAGCDADGRPDAGEYLALVVTVRNTGTTNAAGVTARLRTLSDRVLVSQDLASYGALNAQHYEDGSQAFAIKIPSDVSCLTNATLALDLSAAGGYAVTRTIDLLLESDETLQSFDFFDDMEGTAPNGFTHGATAGADDWHYETSDAFSPTHSWFAADVPGPKDAFLESPPLYVSATSVLTFRHKYILESGFDGAVLEISTDEGGTWTDIGPSYDSSQNPLGPAFGSPFAPGQEFWSGDSQGWQLVTVNLGAMNSPLGEPLYAGQVVLIRWRLGCDDSNTEPPHVGWWIDDISLTDSGSFATACDAAGPCNTVGVGVEELPRMSVLEQNYPNPMSARSVIGFRLAQGDAGLVSLRVFDVSGRRIRTLARGWRPAGPHQIEWDRTDDSGARVGRGVYFYRLETAGRTLARKLVIAD